MIPKALQRISQAGIFQADPVNKGPDGQSRIGIRGSGFRKKGIRKNIVRLENIHMDTQDGQDYG